MVSQVAVHCSSETKFPHSRAGTLWKQNITKAYESKLSTHSKHFVFAMYLENCILKIWYKVQTERFETNIKTSEVLHESVTKQTKNKQLLIVNTISQRCNAMHLRNGKHPCEVQAVISKSLQLSSITFASQMSVNFEKSPYGSKLPTDFIQNFQPLSFLFG